jgi:hypothetical protein
MGISNGRVFSPNAKGFSLNSVHGSRIRIFCGFYAKGTRVCAYSARIKFPNAFKTVRFDDKSKEIIATQKQEIKFHYLLPKFQHPWYKLINESVQHRLG